MAKDSKGLSKTGLAHEWCIDPLERVENQMDVAWRIENLATAVLLVDADRTVLSMNAAGENLFSASHRQIKGQLLDELIPNAAVINAVQRAFHEGERFTEWSVEFVAPNGVNLSVDCMVTPLLETAAVPMAFIEMVNTEGHRRILREELMMTQHEVTCSLVRSIAHEVKNPLGGIRGAAQLLERQLQEDALKEYTRIVINEVDRLRHLVDRMLGPNSLVCRERLNIHEVLERVRNLVEVEVPRTICIDRDYDPSLPELEADRDNLIQAVLNIVRNAVQALGDTGTITLRTRSHRQFTIGLTRHKLALRIDVCDNGPGIPADLQRNVFFPMITGRAEGTGLGLSIAQSLIHKQGGLIEFTSRPGETIFTIWLPLAS